MHLVRQNLCEWPFALSVLIQALSRLATQKDLLESDCEDRNKYWHGVNSLGAEEGAKGTLTFIPAPISSSRHLPPSFLASLSPHYTFFFQHCVF